MAIRSVAAVQMAITDGDGRRNRETLGRLLAGAEGCDLVLGPELWTSGYALDRWEEMADRDTPEALAWMAALARRHACWLGASLITRHEAGGLVNRFHLFDRAGSLAGSYDKAHLFGPMGETERLRAGEVLEVFEVEGLRVAPAICYDLRFPEMFRRLALQGVDLFAVVSEWPDPRGPIMSALAEARAIENQAYVLLANRIGPSATEATFPGRSAVYGPFGPMATAREGFEGLVVAELDMEALRGARSALPVFAQRSPAIDFDPVAQEVQGGNRQLFA